MSNIIFWFRQDLRISDNPGLFAAAKYGKVMPIYIYEPKKTEELYLGSASKWWLYHALQNLNNNLENKLNIYIGDPKIIMLNLVQSNNIQAVYWNRCYEPYRIKNDTEIKAKLKSLNIDCQSFNGSLLWEPWQVVKQDGTPYKVYTYFYRNGCQKLVAPRTPLAKPKNLQLITAKNHQQLCCNNLNQLNLLPKIPWYKEFEKVWLVGETAAQNKLKNFLKQKLLGYKENRNYPEKQAVSRLSPHLHFGEISPHQIWFKAKKESLMNNDLDHFRSELAWREFAYYLLYHFPNLPFKNFQAKFDDFGWQNNPQFLKAWQTGATGYPFIDAGMRELWQTGYIHNRVRMVVGSFLVKNLLIDWRLGAKWFADCLVDADLANNVAAWQWVAGTGTDAAPYFRIFNPITQGEKFDPNGNYTKQFLPVLANLPNKYLFKPWEAPSEILKQSGVVLGKNYPYPIVDLNTSRNQALSLYKSISKSIQ